MRLIPTVNGLEYLSPQFSPFDQIISGFFTRKGGVSPAPFSSLNLSIATGDELFNVVGNRNRILSAIDKPIWSIFDVWQIHSDRVICTDRPREDGKEPQKADAIFTSNPDVTLLMKFADCVPILIYDPEVKVVGIIHAGWQGTVKGIVKKSIEEISRAYSCKPENIHAVIGPSIGPDHYEVGENVAKLAMEVFPLNKEIVGKREERYFFDLWEANAENLRRAGVTHIYQTRICTACHTDHWYSHRAEHGKTGRFAAVIALSNNQRSG